MKIGFFDSGIGGVTVLKEAIKMYPNAHYIYFADTDNVPYGTRKKKEIKALVDDAVDFLVNEMKIDLLVIACNTATSVCIKDLRARLIIPVVGMEPAIKPASLATRNKKSRKRILVSATRITLKQKKLKDLINDLNASDKVDLISLQKLVKFSERKEINSAKVIKYLKKKLSNYDLNKYGAFVLGCTHFVYYRDLIESLLPSHIKLIDGNNGTVNRMIYLIRKTKLPQCSSQVSYYASKRKLPFRKLNAYLDLVEL